MNARFRLAAVVAVSAFFAALAAGFASKSLGSGMPMMLSVALAAAITCGVATLLMRRGSRDDVLRVIEVMQAVADGDFTKSLAADGSDDAARLASTVNAAVTSMRSALERAREASIGVATAAAELTQSTHAIASGAQEQAASLEETASSLEEMTATIRQNADNAQQASQLASGARDIADKGGSVVQAAVAAMGEINKSSKKISDIIVTIDEIAFQTNLLALNAAVEAARAGEQGRGFAVVASEVRTLAQRSADAAKEIKILIGDSVRKVDAGAKLVDQSGRSLGEIVASVKRVSDIIAEIAAASKEQASGVDQLNTAVTQMDSAVQANAVQTEQLSGTAENLAGRAATLEQIVSRFRLGESPTRRAPIAPPKAAAPPQRAEVAPPKAPVPSPLPAVATAPLAVSPVVKEMPAEAASAPTRAQPFKKPATDADLENLSLDDIEPIGATAATTTGHDGFEEF